MSTTTATELTIRDFLALPVGALPGACWVEDYEEGDPWPYLRDALLPEDEQQQNHFDSPVWLVADRDEWRDGVIVRA